MTIKSLLAGLVLAATVSPAAAQQTSGAQTYNYQAADFYEDAKKFNIKHNWFIGIGGGAQIYWGDHDIQCNLNERLAPSISAYIGLWFNPYIGDRLVYSGMSVRGATKRSIDVNYNRYQSPDVNEFGDPFPVAFGTGENISGDREVHKLQKQKFNYSEIHDDVIFNLTNLICGYKPDRRYMFGLYAGLGYAWSHSNDSHRGRTKSVSGRFGILNTWAIAKKLDLLVDVAGAIYDDTFDGEDRGRWGEGMLSAQIGLSYHFGGTERSPYHTNTELRVNDLLNSMSLENARLGDALHLAMEEAARAKADCDKRSVTKSVVRKIGNASNFVTFVIDKTYLTNEARKHLAMLAEALKKLDGDGGYRITGFADEGTGTPGRNEYLARERAKRVYDCLVNEFGVNPELLTVEHKGGVPNMFYNDPALSRSVFILPIEELPEETPGK